MGYNLDLLVKSSTLVFTYSKIFFKKLFEHTVQYSRIIGTALQNDAL